MNPRYSFEFILYIVASDTIYESMRCFELEGGFDHYPKDLLQLVRWIPERDKDYKSTVILPKSIKWISDKDNYYTAKEELVSFEQVIEYLYDDFFNDVEVDDFKLFSRLVRIIDDENNVVYENDYYNEYISHKDNEDNLIITHNNINRIADLIGL